MRNFEVNGSQGEAHISTNDAERAAGAEHADAEAAGGCERDVAGVPAMSATANAKSHFWRES